MKKTILYRQSRSRVWVAGMILLLLLPVYRLQAQALPAAPAKLLDNAVRNWNEVYGRTVHAEGWTYEGVISSGGQLATVLAEITDPAKTWMPDGDFNRPTEMTARRVADVPSVTRAEISAWSARVRALVKTGQHLARVRWTKGAQSFTTLCITDDRTIIYDNMFSNIFMVDHHSRCLSYRLGWIWQSKYEDMTRGEITADLVIQCDGSRPTCDHRCNAWMSAGDAQITCSVTTTANCCKLSWAYGWACGFKSVKINAAKVSVSIEGHLGSSGTGSGSCTECCPLANISVPVQPVQTAGGSAGVNGPQQVSTVSVKTISGEVVDVKIPNNIRPGDPVSGTVTPGSASSTLQGAVVDVENKKTGVAEKIFRFTVPLGTASIPLIIRDPAGNEIGRTTIPVNVPSMPVAGNNVTVPLQQIETPKAPSPGNFAPLNYCQPGQPLTINGNFDGDASNTRVTIGGVPAEIIAESPRGSFVQVPSGLPPGKSTIKIEEGTASASMPLQVITLQLSADKSIVQKGTKATVTATVRGLDNLDIDHNNFKLELTNSSPGVIEFRGATGNRITREISSGQVNDGIYHFSTEITGVATGPYTMDGAVTSTTASACWKQYEDCIARCEAEEKKCYENCDKGNKGLDCYLACSAAARLCEAECFAVYLRCLHDLFGY